MKGVGTSLEGLEAGTPVGAAAARVLKVRLAAVEKHLRALKQLGTIQEAQTAESDRAVDEVRTVHQLRVVTRRADTALRVFRAWVDGPDWKKARKLLRRVRAAAGKVRDADVRRAMLNELRAGTRGSQAGTLEYLAARTAEERDLARGDLVEMCGGRFRRKIRKRRRALVRAAREHVPEPDTAAGLSDGAAAGLTLGAAARLVLPSAAGAVREASRADLMQLTRLHALRKAVKRLRYTLEVLSPALPAPEVQAATARLAELQGHLGEINDADCSTQWLAVEAAVLQRPEGQNGPVSAEWTGVAGLTERYRALRDQRLRRFLESGGMASVDRALEAVGRLAENGAGAPKQAVSPDGGVGGQEKEPGVRLIRETGGGVRLAAIDVGSNSTRLVIAEAHGDGSYRLLDDEREPTRLAAGLVLTGLLDPAVMGRAVDVIARMKGIAEGYGCAAIRAVATAAVREAGNRAEFVALVRERAGLEIRVVSAEEEAHLAFLSASRAFGDMQTIAAGVVDIGGASTEVVLSSRGVAEAVFSLPLGAVRLTESFGGAEDSAGPRYKEMRRWVKETVGAGIGAGALEPEVLVGTGGTVTTLAAIAMHREGAGSALGSATGQGYQIKHETVKEILDELRRMSLEKRKRVDGLSAERADIIVPGITIIEVVMRHLGAPRLRVHERGVRDGVILQMMREAFPGQAGSGTAVATRRDRLGAARRLAQACRSEERHSEHVAKLALEIFDGLAPVLPQPDDLWTGPAARELLEAGAVLHDIGYIVSYAKHHKHAYHLILHADALSEGAGAFSRREVQIIACLARYHRRSDPDEKDAELNGLSPEDRLLLRRLAAVLRIADGLDRTHSQNVRGASVRVENGTVVIELDAAEDPATDIWGASRKAGLLKEVFGTEPRFLWKGAPAEPASAPGGNGHMVAAMQ